MARVLVITRGYAATSLREAVDRLAAAIRVAGHTVTELVTPAKYEELKGLSNAAVETEYTTALAAVTYVPTSDHVTLLSDDWRLSGLLWKRLDAAYASFLIANVEATAVPITVTTV